MGFELGNDFRCLGFAHVMPWIAGELGQGFSHEAPAGPGAGALLVFAVAAKPVGQVLEVDAGIADKGAGRVV